MAKKQKRTNDGLTRNWIIEKSLEIIPNYEKGVLSIRGLFYQLIATKGFANSHPHYKRVIGAMTKARKDGLIDYDTFSDFGRAPLGETGGAETYLESKIDAAKSSIYSTMRDYSRNRWENQEYFVEVWVEKQALQGVFNPICREMNVALCACKGHPSLTFIDDAHKRFKQAIKRGQTPVILYFGDYDATGVVIDKKIRQTLFENFGLNVEVKRVCLTKPQVLYWGLEIAPNKKSDSNTKEFEANGGLGQVELDAVEPKKLQRICKYSIGKLFCNEKYKELKEIEAKERIIFREEMKAYVQTL